MTLVLAAHGTRSAAGEATLAALADRVRRARPGRRVELAYLEISSPLLADVLARVPGPVVVVPLLLAGGYHIHIDLPAVVARARPDALIAGHLGPHPLVTSVLARRLASAGLRPTDAVVLGAAGSSDPAAVADVRAAARLLSVRLARPVTAAFASAAAPTPAEALQRLRSGPAPRVAIASYLLAPGFFQGRLEAAEADLVSRPLGADDDLAALVWHRFDQAMARSAVPAAPAARPGQESAGARGATASSRSSRTISRAPSSRDRQAPAPMNIS
ncbi:cobalamin biosynthesis protein CbiX [Sphaerisporangium melleum]|uniref:Cobalamin biosynthesis protein CbiX n=1 Tax=Sphaerisporangium melleum TaxID=321316 RepID=A0A917RNH1_9ACTN|nr:CbiX/SirB N-terminal domain-containing protein [Sphaerisporangium melleum]GGL16358.1 cobalamin biosynthesis protein CbiX [Sphaerisporangium melleum]GII70588.1 cobalamin biosynthesis protein CbiX [Sphaerisporangium melleum]